VERLEWVYGSFDDARHKVEASLVGDESRRQGRAVPLILCGLWGAPPKFGAIWFNLASIRSIA
jgi:hypothetical protein